jgi:hypothetical protein
MIEREGGRRIDSIREWENEVYPLKGEFHIVGRKTARRKFNFFSVFAR